MSVPTTPMAAPRPSTRLGRRAVLTIQSTMSPTAPGTCVYGSSGSALPPRLAFGVVPKIILAIVFGVIFAAVPSGARCIPAELAPFLTGADSFPAELAELSKFPIKPSANMPAVSQLSCLAKNANAVSRSTPSAAMTRSSAV